MNKKTKYLIRILLISSPLIFGYFILQYSSIADKARTEITLKYLRNTRTNLVSYKNKFGIYPDSLNQLQQINNMIIYTDLFKMKGKILKKEDNNLSYKRLGDTFELFSIGPDKQPYTSDDITYNTNLKYD